MNRLIIQYPRGLDIQVSIFDADGNKMDSVAMAPPLLLRLGPNLELESMSSGNLKTLLDLSRSESDDNEDMSDEEDSAMEDDTDPDPNATIDLSSSDDGDSEDGDTDDDDTDDDDDEKEEEEEDFNPDMIVVSYNTDV